jgi:hypothetical protein
MFSTVLQNLKTSFGDYFGRAFILGVFLPVFIFMGANLALYFEVTQGIGTTIAAWDKLSAATQVLLSLAGLMAAFVLAYLLYNFQDSFVRLFEGYWPHVWFLRRLGEWRTNIYKQRWTDLDVKAQDEQLAFYPPPTHLDQFMPTRIGNILRAAELYAYDRYGIDSPTIWTRLSPLLKDDALAPLLDTKVARDFMLLMSVLLVPFTLIWCPLLLIFTTYWPLFLLCAAGLPLAWLCYQNAIQSSLAYSEQLKAIFDLHRHELFDALGLPRPEKEDEEREQWQNIGYFFYRNLPMPDEKVLGWPKPQESPPKGGG